MAVTVVCKEAPPRYCWLLRSFGRGVSKCSMVGLNWPLFPLHALVFDAPSLKPSARLLELFAQVQMHAQDCSSDPRCHEQTLAPPTLPSNRPGHSLPHAER